MKALVQFTLYLEISELFSAFHAAGGAAASLGSGVFFSPKGAPAPANALLCPRGSASWTLAQIESVRVWRPALGLGLMLPRWCESVCGAGPRTQ